MIPPMQFLDAVSGYTRSRTDGSADKAIRLAVIDPAYDPFDVAFYPDTVPPARVTFEGESTLSGKAYPVASGFIPYASNRVWMVPIGTTYLIAGSVGNYASQGFYANAGFAGVEFGDGSYFDTTSGLFLTTDAEIQGDLAVGGIGAFLYKAQTGDGPSVTNTSTVWSTAPGLYIDLPIGTWETHANLGYTCTAGDIQGRWAFTGTWSSGKFVQGASPFNAGTGTVNDANSRDASAERNGWHQSNTAIAYAGNDSGGYAGAHEWGIQTVTAPGRWSIEYTQRTANAAATIMRSVSYLTARRVA